MVKWLEVSYIKKAISYFYISKLNHTGQYYPKQSMREAQIHLMWVSLYITEHNGYIERTGKY